jgi:flagellar basal body-associated protein FliL
MIRALLIAIIVVIIILIIVYLVIMRWLIDRKYSVDCEFLSVFSSCIICKG